MSVSIREAVERLDPATRNWLGMRDLLQLLVRDPTSRLIAIRDVILYIVMLMLPDPRISCADLQREVEWDAATLEQLRERYRIPGLVSWSLEAIRRDYPDWPFVTRHHFYDVKCCRGHVVVFTNSMSTIAIFDSKRRLVASGRLKDRNIQGIYLIDDEPFVIPGRSCTQIMSGRTILPCGVTTNSCYAFNDAGESMELITNVPAIRRDDYGVAFDTNDVRSELCLFTQWVQLI